jgi:hypothetical protein
MVSLENARSAMKSRSVSFPIYRRGSIERAQASVSASGDRLHAPFVLTANLSSASKWPAAARQPVRRAAFDVPAGVFALYGHFLE